jgi:hypothetical protein
MAKTGTFAAVDNGAQTFVKIWPILAVTKTILPADLGVLE